METRVLDFGNTRIKMAKFTNRQLSHTESYDTLSSVITALSDDERVIPTIISNVSLVESDLEQILKKVPTSLVLNHETKLPIQNQYKSPQTLGFDRIAAAVGANFLFPNKKALIIDLGTALKIDVVHPTEGFIGGMISPGLAMRFQALHTFTQKLPLLHAVDYPELIGQTTSACLQSGVINGMLHEINGIIESYLKISNYEVIISGGDALFFESRIKTPKFTEPNLTLIGLNRILEYNVEKNNHFS